MLLGAIIGMVVGIIFMLIKSIQKKKSDREASSKSDILDDKL